MLFKKPLHLTVLEEIALDGLEGVTLPDLFTRICHTFGPAFIITPQFKALVWKFILASPDYEFFRLPQPRRDLVILTRMLLDGKIKSDMSPVVYTYNPVEVDGIRGSCQDYQEREPVSREALTGKTWEQVLGRYGQFLVIVASQERREGILNPRKIDKELSITQYCALEKIGRSREVGELIAGTYSLADIMKTLKSGPNYAM